MMLWREVISTIAAIILLCTGEADDHHKAPPPTRPPADILAQLTQDDAIPMEYYYVDDSNQGTGTHYVFSFEDIEGLIGQAGSFAERVLSMPHPPTPPTSLPASTSWLTQLTDAWLIHALKTHSIKGKDVVVFGSTSPFYEALALAMGARHITVIEYNKLTYSHPNITTVQVADLQDDHYHFADCALSLSSFDHDGLGRYGDPINPDADLNAMSSVQDVLKPDGVLFLTVPIGPDVVVWNLHRRYGKLRLPRLLHGWEEVERVGWREELLEQPSPYTHAYEPVFVLKPLPSI